MIARTFSRGSPGAAMSFLTRARICGNAAPERGQLFVLGFVARLAPLRMVTVLLATARVAACHFGCVPARSYRSRRSVQAGGMASALMRASVAASATRFPFGCA